jgi:hypothetical protein
MTSSLDFATDLLNLSNQVQNMTDEQLTEAMAATHWWSEVERCWNLTFKPQEPEVTPLPEFEMTAEEFPLLFDLLKA